MQSERDSHAAATQRAEDARIAMETRRTAAEDEARGLREQLESLRREAAEARGRHESLETRRLELLRVIEGDGEAADGAQKEGLRATAVTS